MPFDDEPERQAKVTSKVKDLGRKSIFSDLPKKPKLADFQENVRKIEDKKVGHINDLSGVVQRILAITSDKTLKINQDNFNVSIKNEALRDLIDMLGTINNDENEPEGHGSVTGIGLLFKIIFSQTDRINNLEYQVQSMQEEVRRNDK